MRGKRALSICTTLLIMLLAIAGCGKKEDMTGKWVYTAEETGETSTLEFFSDGTGICTVDESSYSCTWIIENGRLKIEIDGGIFGRSSYAYDYKLDGDTLVLTTNGGRSGTYYRE